LTVCKKLVIIELSPQEEKALDEYEKYFWWTTGRGTIRRTGAGKNDWGKGYASGEQVEIQGGVGAFDERLSLEAPA
jgi:hypothetical protein